MNHKVFTTHFLSKSLSSEPLEKMSIVFFNLKFFKYRKKRIWKKKRSSIGIRNFRITIYILALSDNVFNFLYRDSFPIVT